jgi:hypothetical protein
LAYYPRRGFNHDFADIAMAYSIGLFGLVDNYWLSFSVNNIKLSTKDIKRGGYFICLTSLVLTRAILMQHKLLQRDKPYKTFYSVISTIFKKQRAGHSSGNLIGNNNEYHLCFYCVKVLHHSS